MPLLAYFWKVGAALLALLFVVDLCLPKEPITDSTSVDRPAIRIRSDRKWPERVVLDTSLPTIMAAARETSGEPAASADRAEPPVIRTETPAVANALAMVRTSQLPREAVDRKRSHKTQHIAMRARRQSPPQMLLAARQAQFAWFGYRFW